MNEYFKQTSMFNQRPILILYVISLSLLLMLISTLWVIGINNSFWISSTLFFLSLLIVFWSFMKLSLKEYRKIKGLKIKKPTTNFLKRIGFRNIQFNEFKIKKIKQLLKKYFEAENNEMIINEVICFLEEGKTKKIFSISATFIVALWIGLIFLSLNFYFESLASNSVFWTEYIAIIVLSLFFCILFMLSELLIRTFLERKIDRNIELIEYLREIKMDILIENN